MQLWVVFTEDHRSFLFTHFVMSHWSYSGNSCDTLPLRKWNIIWHEGASGANKQGRSLLCVGKVDQTENFNFNSVDGGNPAVTQFVEFCITGCFF